MPAQLYGALSPLFKGYIKVLGPKMPKVNVGAVVSCVVGEPEGIVLRLPGSPTEWGGMSTWSWRGAKKLNAKDKPCLACQRLNHFCVVQQLYLLLFWS